MSRFSDAQVAQLQQAIQHAQSTGQLAEVIGPNMLATLNPPTDDTRIKNGVPYREMQVYYPEPWMPVATDIAYSPNDRVVQLLNGTANTEAIERLGFDVPTVVYATVSSVRSTNANLPTTVQDARDLFRVQFELTNGRKWQTNPALGTAVTGTAERPRLLGRTGWRFDMGTVLQVKITPLIADLEINIVLYTIETPGATNIASGR